MAKPTRFEIGQGAAGTALFNQLLQGGAGARPSAYITGGLPTARRGTPIPIIRKRPPEPQIGLRGIRDISALPAGGGMTRLQRDLAAKMGLGAPRPTFTTARESIGDKIAGILPAAGTPEAAGLGAAGARMLQLSGYSDRPISTSQILGEAAQSYMKEAKEARAAQAAAEKEARAAQAAAELANRPQIKVAGDRLFKVYPDGTTELIAGKMAKPAEVKSEGPRIRTEGGKEIETVYDKYNNLYPAGAAMTEENRISPDSFTVVSQFSEMDVARRTQGRDTLRQSEKAIKTIDRLASEIQKLGPSAFDRIKDDIITSLKSKDPDRFGSLSDEEIARQVAAGQLQALVGQARLSLFGPGVLTESEAALARQVFVGGDVIENPEVALNNLWAIRQGFYEDYNEDVDYFNSFRGNQYKKYSGEDKFNWNQYIDADGRVRLAPQQTSEGSSGAGQRTTASGLTYTFEE